jgi:molybdopterin-guanine dinucleotide biosynthesis protein A
MSERAIYLLCGGRSRRLGRDKRLVDVGGQPLIEVVVGQLAALGLPIFLGLDAGDDGTPALEGVGRWWDVRPGRGPLPNLLTALRRFKGEILLCPGDRLLTEGAALTALLACAEAAPTAAAVVFEIEGRPEPLHGLYRQDALEPLAAAWDEGCESLRDALAGLAAESCVRLPIEDLGIDLNTPSELISMRQLAKEAPWMSGARV